jgi:hypothetical protein
VQIQLVHAVTQQRGAKLSKLLAQLYAYAVPAAVAAATAAAATGDSASSSESTTAATATATSGASSAECSNSSATTVSSTGSHSSDSTMVAVQQSVLMKMMVDPEGWYSAIENGVKLISHMKVSVTLYKLCTWDKGTLLEKFIVV